MVLLLPLVDIILTARSKGGYTTATSSSLLATITSQANHRRGLHNSDLLHPLIDDSIGLQRFCTEHKIKLSKKQKNPEGYSPLIGWIETHKGKDQASISYREQVLKKAAGMENAPDAPLTVISSILDSISGGHHGGYERGIGSGSYRRYMTTPIIHDYAMAQTQKEANNAMESKVQQLESALDIEKRAREELIVQIGETERRNRAAQEEMERHHQEAQERSTAQMEEMHRYMSSFFNQSRNASGSR